MPAHEEDGNSMTTELARLRHLNMRLAKVLGEFSCECGDTCEEGARSSLLVPKGMCAHHRASTIIAEAKAGDYDFDPADNLAMNDDPGM